MKVLVLHNRYRQSGGEDAAARREIDMLRGHAVDVIEHEVENGAGLGSVAVIGESAWSRSSYRLIRELCTQVRPDIVHVHNFWMRLTPSVHAAAHEAGAATVQTLHNYRLICANGLLLRKGQICEDCVGASPWRGAAQRCYRNSWVASAAVVHMTAHNQRRDTWNRDVDAFIAPSESARAKLLYAGLPQERVFVKPNFAEDPGAIQVLPSASRWAVFAGRLAREKGVHLLLSAWARITGAQLIIAGDGPEREALERQAADLRSVVFTGSLGAQQVTDLMKQARCVVVPSIGLETFGGTVVEAFACGRPVIASALGSPSELVRDGWNGFQFTPSDPAALTQRLEHLLNDGAIANEFGANGRADYLARFTPGANFGMLNRIYQFALEHAGGVCARQ